MIRIIFAVVLATTIAACSAPDQAQDADAAGQPVKDAMNIDSKTWQLVDLGGEPAPEGDMALTMSLDTKSARVSGYAGCNRYFAQYTIHGDTLSLGPIGATKRMCGKRAMALEERFLAVFSGDLQFRVASDELVLTASDGSELAFSKAPSPK